ncbi:MAG: hypothetical protein JWR04_453 [Rhodoglobus sp.]|nr:hypothetical protein [Rhodoglobus sp.]
MASLHLRVIVVIDAIVIAIFTAGSVLGNYLPLGFAVLIVIGMGFQIWSAASLPRSASPVREAPHPEQQS